MDGSGKTTIAKLLAQQTGSIYLNPLDGNPLSTYKNLFEDVPLSIHFLYWLGLRTIAYRRTEQLRNISDVLVDRTIMSSIAYNKAEGLSDHWLKLIPSFLIKQIDFMFYFHASDEERLRRIKVREHLKGIINPTDYYSLTYSKKIDEEYRKLVPEKSILVSTENSTPDEIVSKLKSRFFAKAMN